MRRSILIALTIIFVMSSFVLFGFVGGVKQAEAAKKYIMRIGTATAEGHPQNYIGEKFKAKIESETDGKIAVSIYPAGQLGSTSQMVQGIITGGIQGLISPTSFMQSIDPSLVITDLPGFYPNVTVAAEIMNGPAGDIVRDRVDKKGVIIISFHRMSQKGIISRESVSNLDEVKGQKIRVMGSKLSQDEVAALGAVPVPMDVPELITALQQGTVDGACSDEPFMRNIKAYERAKHFLLEPQSPIVSAFVVSKKWMNTLPPELQEAVRDAAKSLIDDATTYAEQYTEKAAQIMKQEGVTFYELPAAEKKLTIEKYKMAQAAFLKDNPDLKPLYETIKKTLEK